MCICKFDNNKIFHDWLEIIVFIEITFLFSTPLLHLFIFCPSDFGLDYGSIFL